ncbi:NAD dependent epimerase/dehydratase [Punctularia strigosozonata HHB-11173 SS5]|uniref:NAD dependent epimerase/dehydratase n=1 Tax=Punctularia strigosozonata (strain HHB-11173) TaxID=741275 RepID=UPI0004416BF1|nr:NAD dependent epimerase/dehydratase [Punctularia strigosozonata HHB-11173 SS5]EIN08271.1 NAD dependent epimerase/dehydratase [Punctularia strigosozonata HHB-11173 SS5]
MGNRLIITGASGVLGTAIYDAFKAVPKTEVLGLAFTNAKPGLQKLDLQDREEVERVFTEFKPDWVIHCAAERRPDVAQKNPDGTRNLNVNVSGHLAQLAKTLGYTLVYISTDYVFDGQSPPYSVTSPTNPLNLYGETKRDGENAVLGVDSAKVVVLRVPVLYGPTPRNSDSAINILLDVVHDQSGKQYKMDHYQTRFPTNVIDIAHFLVRLTAVPEPLPRIMHYSAQEPFTKYEICLIFAQLLGLPHAHIIPDAEPPKDATARPKDTQLDVHETEELLMRAEAPLKELSSRIPDKGGIGLGCSGFEEWWAGYLKVGEPASAFSG